MMDGMNVTMILKPISSETSGIWDGWRGQWIWSYMAFFSDGHVENGNVGIPRRILYRFIYGVFFSLWDNTKIEILDVHIARLFKSMVGPFRSSIRV